MTRALRLQLHPFEFALSQPRSNAKHAWNSRQGVLISLLNSDGYVGIGEAAPLPSFSPDTYDQAVRCLSQLAQVQPTEQALELFLEGRGVLSRELQALQALPSVRYGLELALLELHAQRVGQPLWQYLCRWMGKSLQAAEDVSVNALADGLEPEAVLEQAAAAWELGFSVLKLKVGRPGRHRAEVELLECLRARGPRGLRFRLDANGSYPLASVLSQVQDLAGPDIEGFEEPVPAPQLLSLPPLPVPVLLDESLLLGPERLPLLPLFREGRVKGVVLKPSLLGGLRASLSWAEPVLRLGGRLLLTHTHEGPVGQLGVVALAQALGGKEQHGLDCTSQRADWERAFPLLHLPGWTGSGWRRLAVPGLGLTGMERCQAGPLCHSNLVGPEIPSIFAGVTARWAATQPHTPAIIEGGEIITWQLLHEQVLKLSRELETQHPCPAEALVLVATLERSTLVRLLACWELGRLVIPLHPAWTEMEQQRALEKLPLAWRWLAPESGAFHAPAHSEGEARAHHQQLVDSCQGQLPAVLLFTSGTSGRPKGVVLTQQNLQAAADGSALRLGWKRTDRWLLALPLGHVGGLTVLLRCWRAGIPVVLSRQGRALSPEVLRQNLEWHQISHLSVVPTQLHRLLELPEKQAPASLRRVLVGGAAASEALLSRARAHGWPVLATYGMTETCAQLCTQVPEEVLLQRELGETVTKTAERAHAAAFAEVGPPLYGMEVRLVQGEVAVRGPALAPVRWLPDAPRRWTPLAGADGFYLTGDLGVLTEHGRLQLLGRASELIISGGENISPLELEQLLEQHPAIQAACVFGIPDEQWGELVAAVLVLQEALTLESLERWLKPRIAGFKRPRRFFVLDQLPLVGVGKLHRQEARRLALTGAVPLR